jgi:hypothetical protein
VEVTGSNPVPPTTYDFNGLQTIDYSRPFIMKGLFALGQGLLIHGRILTIYGVI